MTAESELPDEWPEGLRIGIKSLSRKSVRRAADAADVLRVVLQHNLRRNNSEHRHRSHIDPARTCLNEVLFGSADPERGVELALQDLARLGLALPARVNGVIAFELVVQCPPGADVPEFWAECGRWLHTTYQHPLSIAVHRDQERSHAHAVVLAVHDGHLAGRDMQREEFGVPRLRTSFLNHIRASLGLRPDRPNRPLVLGVDIRGHGHSKAQEPMSITQMSRIGSSFRFSRTTKTKLKSLNQMVGAFLRPMSPCPAPAH